MVDANVEECKQNVQNFVTVVAPAATLARRDFFCFYCKEILSVNHKKFL